jgi:hypothetical protein
MTAVRSFAVRVGRVRPKAGGELVLLREMIEARVLDKVRKL